MTNIFGRYERLAAYLPLAGTAIVLTIQNFFQDFLASFRIGLAIATLAISLILTTWFLESRIRNFSTSLGNVIQRIDQLADEQPRILSAANSNFQVVALGDGFKAAANAVPHVERMRIYAASSTQMNMFIQHNKIRIEHCSILIQRPSRDNRIYANEINRTIERWKLLARQGAIGKLEILRYNFQPTEYECIFDSKYLIHGLFNPDPHDNSGVIVRDPMIVSAQSPSGTALIAAFIDRYDTLFEYCRNGYGPNDPETVYGPDFGN